MHQDTPPNRSGKVLAGFIVLTIGFVLLFKQLDFWFFPSWVFSWPMILIVVGLLIGARNNFRSFGWTIPVLLGGFFLLDRWLPMISFQRFFWPFFIIAMGLYLIFGRQRFSKEGREHRGLRHDYPSPASSAATSPATDSTFSNPTFLPPPAEATAFDGAQLAGVGNPEFINSVSVFASIKKTVISKNVTGGDIVSFLGGTEINLTQADIHGRVVLDVVQVLGGTKLIIPSHWDVVSEMNAVLGGIEDKRTHNPHVNKDKLLVIKGTSVLGGIEIHSYV